RRSLTSQSKMALPVRTNGTYLFKFIQKFRSPKRFFCSGACSENKDCPEPLQAVTQNPPPSSSAEAVVQRAKINRHRRPGAPSRRR
ncbi:hypothetical protein D4764_01G0002400, partial [Takifugu flavidus]